jgi:phosphatidylserine/phosphatidylglycerophosphate/cardiolipin synthase-like enzyme
MVIDRTTVETGSFNYTGSANKRNAENALVLRGVPDLAEAYLKEWRRLWDEGESFAP